MKLNYMGSGKIFFDNREYKSDLYTNEQEGGILLKAYIEKPLAGFLDLPIDIPSLPGELSTGFKFTLLNCKRYKMENQFSKGTSVYTYFSQYFIKGIGKGLSENPKFNKMDFCIPYIMPWGMLSAYKIGDKYELISNEEEKKEIYKNEHYCISYWVNGDMLPFHSSELMREKIILEQNGNIEISFKNEETIQTFVDIFNKIKRLIELSTLINVHPSKITGWSNYIYDMYGERKINRPIEIVSRDFSGNTNIEKSFENRKWITLTELISNNSFSQYFSKYELLEPIIELYVEIIHSENISHRRVFLNIIQALETYHSRFKTNSIDEFKKRIATVILKDRPQSFIKSDTAFLMANSRRFITLESRMADLLLADFKIYFDTGDIKHTDFPNVIANTRNYYIHYDETIKDRGRVLSEEELSIYNRSLLYILEYYILLELGFSSIENIREKLKERWGCISDTLMIIKHSNNRNKTSTEE